MPCLNMNFSLYRDYKNELFCKLTRFNRCPAVLQQTSGHPVIALLSERLIQPKRKNQRLCEPASFFITESDEKILPDGYAAGGCLPGAFCTG